MPYLPLAPVSDAIFALLTADATLDGLLSGRIYTDIPEDPQYPLLWFELHDGKQLGGLGTKPGRGAFGELVLRLHIHSQYAGMAPSHAILARIYALLFQSQAIVAVGYTMQGDGQPAPNPMAVSLHGELLGNVKTTELVAELRLWAEEQ